MLTKKQRELLILIHTRMKKGEVAPSFDEMRMELGLKSKSGIHRLITALVERGYLERLPNRARALEIKKLPEGYADPNDDDGNVVQIPTTSNIIEIPLYGRIAAGSPIEAIRDENGTVEIPPMMITQGDHYALEVDGNSMIKAGINDGDTVIIKKTDQVRDGDIVVALVDGEEVTLKRLKRDGSKIILIPENDEYSDQTYHAEQVQIQGKLASLLRTYH